MLRLVLIVTVLSHSAWQSIAHDGDQDKSTDTETRLKTLETKFDDERQRWEADRQRLMQKLKTLEKHCGVHKNDGEVEEPAIPYEAPTNNDETTRDMNVVGKAPAHLPKVRSDDPDPLQQVVEQMSQRLDQMAAEMETQKNTVNSDFQALRNTNARQDQAIQESATSTYTRWGHTQCPSSAELVYTGVAGGAWFDNAGSTTTAFCLPLNPHLSTRSHPTNFDYLCGAEYQTGDSSTHQKDPVCAVCRTNRPSTIMMAATNQCENGWTLEYHGHLMGSLPSDGANHEAVCMDSAAEGRAGSSGNENGFLFYYMFTYCGSLPCPPYENDKWVTCAVCSK